jgi:hypothetical protein
MPTPSVTDPTRITWPTYFSSPSRSNKHFSPNPVDGLMSSCWVWESEFSSDSGLCHEAHFLPPPEDENKLKLIPGSEANETDPSSEDSELEVSRPLTSNLTLHPPKKIETKDDLVRRLKSLGDELESSETELSPKLLMDFKEAWLRIANKSNEFFDVRIPHSKQEEEDLRVYTARLLFLAKYFCGHLRLRQCHYFYN